MCGGHCGQRLLQLSGIGVQPDGAAGHQRVEDRARFLTGAHGEGQLGVLHVRRRLPGLVGADEAVNRVEHQVGRRVDLAGGEIQHAAAADRGELVPVTDQRQPGSDLVGDGQQRPGGVLVEHPGLVDDQEVTHGQLRRLPRAGVGHAGGRADVTEGQPGPGPVAAPAPAVLEGQPRRRPGGGADLGGGHLRRLQRRRHDEQPAALVCEELTGGGEGGGLARAGRALHHQRSGPGECGRGGRLPGIQPLHAIP